MYKKISYFIASVGGVGFIPLASGTFGSLVTLPIVWAAWYYWDLSGMLLVCLFSFVLGCLATKEVLKHTKHDPSLVVIDEVAGQSLAFILVVDYLNIWWVWLAGFILFRLFDIFKIGPVKYFDEKVENEYGVMLDDVAAGLIAAVFLRFIIFIDFL